MESNKRKADLGPSPPKPPDSKKNELEHSICDPVAELTSALTHWSPQGQDNRVLLDSSYSDYPIPLTPFNSDASVRDIFQVEDIEVDDPEAELSDQFLDSEESEQPVIFPAAASMAVVLPQVELGLREEIVGLIEEATLLYTRVQPPPAYDKARRFLETVAQKIMELQKISVIRIGKQGTQELRTAHRKEWSTIKMDFENQLDTALAGLRVANPAVNPVDQDHNNKVAAKLETIKQLKAQIDGAVDQLTKDMVAKTSDDQQLSKALLSLFQQRLNDIKKMIKPELGILYQELIVMDPAQKDAHGVAFTSDVAAKDKLVNDLYMDLTMKPVNEASFGASALHSTPLNQSLVDGSVQSTLSRSVGSRGYDYRKGNPPVFDGSYLSYPAWREEMMNDVCVGRGDSAYVRILQENSPVKNLCALCPTPAKAWDFLNDKFCNPSLVSGEITLEFLSKKNIKGTNDQQKLVQLHETVRELHNNLQLVQELTQLRDIPSMQLQIIKLTPVSFRTELARHLNTLAKDKPGGKLEPAENYKAISEWLEETHRYLVIHCQDALAQRSNTPPAHGGGHGGSHGGGRPKGTGLHAHDARKKKGSSRYGDCWADVPDDQKPEIEAKWASNGPCPKCGALGHVYEGGKEGQWMASTSLSDCPQFFSMDVDARASFVMHKKFCCKCLSTLHETANCDKKKERWYCRVKKPNGDFCKQSHSNYLHGTQQRLLCHTSVTILPDFKVSATIMPDSEVSATIMPDSEVSAIIQPDSKVSATILPDSEVSATILPDPRVLATIIPDSKVTATFDMSRWSPTPSDDPDSKAIMNRDVMLPVVTVRLSKDILANILLDGGSQSSLVTHRLATLMKLEAHSAVYEIRVIGHKPEIKQLKYYLLTIKDNSGKDRKLVLLGLDEISEMPGRFSDVDVAYDTFPHVPHGSLDKAAGPIDILIGNDNVDLLPGGGLGEDLVDQLRVYQIPFGPGRVLTGSHPQIRFDNPEVTPEARGWYSAQFLPTTICPGIQTQEIIASEPLSEADLQADLDMKEWIMTKDFVRKLPDTEKKKRIVEAIGLKPSIAVLPFKAAQEKADVGHLRKAEMAMAYSNLIMIAWGIIMFIIMLFSLAAMGQLREDLTKIGNKSSLDLLWSHGVARTRDRLPPVDMIATTGYDSLVVLPAKFRLAELLGLAAHNEDQKVADLTKEILNVPCCAFSYVSIDYAGSLAVDGVVNRRATRKVYPLIICDISSRALYIGLAVDHSLEDFITALAQSLKYAKVAAIISRRLFGVSHHVGGEGDVCVTTPSLLITEDQSGLEAADPDLHMCEEEPSTSSPNGPNVPETPYSPGPTVETGVSELDETQPLLADVTVPLDPHQTRLHTFGVRSLLHLCAPRSEVTCWQCNARQEISQCEKTVIPRNGKKSNIR